MPRPISKFIGSLIIGAAVCTAIYGQAARIAANAGPPAGHKLIWILGSDGRLSGYDGETFRLWTSSRSSLPSEAFRHPENVTISQNGQALYAGTASGTHLRRLWITDNFTRELTGGSDDTRPASGGGFIETSATPAVYFSADGQRLYWFENRFSVLQRENEGDVSETGEFLSWTSDLDGAGPKQVATIALPQCKCETGACEETCPVIDAWAPSACVSDFFFLTRYITHQVSSDYQETDLYQLMNGAWISRKLPAPVEQFLDAVDHGNTYISATPDAGCCGWVNESDDVTVLVRSGGQTTLFDEFSRFNNRDYDISFSTSNALFSPGAAAVAYTITSTSKPGEEIRLADGGRANPEELRVIQKSLVNLPQVEVVALPDAAKPRISLPNAELIGWLDSQRILVLQRGQLLIVDSASGQAKSTGLSAGNPVLVFIR